MTRNVAVADTHALIFALIAPRRLGSSARKFMKRVAVGEATLFISAFGLVELADSNRAGRIHLPLPFESWIGGLLASRQFRIADLTLEIVLRSRELYGITERGDRLITATALVLECPLITRDAQITSSGEVECIW